MNQKPIVFIVDDSEQVRTSLTRLISAAGFEVESMDSPEKFLERELPDRPSCVVLDLKMPESEFDGIQLQQKLNDSGRHTQIIFLTGEGEVKDSVKAMKAGAVDFIEKPGMDVLVDAVKQAIARDIKDRAERARRAEIEKRLSAVTPRERQVFERVITGMLNKQIAMELGTTEKTIKVHRARVMEKLRAESVAELVRMAETVGIRGPTDRNP